MAKPKRSAAESVHKDRIEVPNPRGTARKSAGVPLFARIDPTLRDWLRDKSENLAGLTEKQVLSNILNYIKSLNNPELVGSILTGKATPDSSAVGTIVSEAIELTVWAEHAFVRPFYMWALEEYSHLHEIVGAEDVGLKRLAHYKQSYCYGQTCLELRSELLERQQWDKWDEYYEAADHCAYLSLWHSQEFERLGGLHPAVIYNKACAFSLRAQFAVERSLGWDSEFMKKMAPAPVNPASQPGEARIIPSDSKALQRSIWKDLGEKWRDEIPRREIRDLEYSVDRYSESSLNHLHKLSEYDDNHSIKKHIYDIAWLYNLADEDWDLTFIRFDPKTRERFGRWVTDHRETKLKLSSFHRPRRTLPTRLQKKDDMIR
jgi:hypothetical protein